MVTLLLLGLIITLAPQLHNVPRNPLADLMQNPRDAVIFAFVVMIAGGVREEIQRGFILHRFEQYLGGGAVGVIVLSSLFGLGHFVQGWDVALTRRPGRCGAPSISCAAASSRRWSATPAST